MKTDMPTCKPGLRLLPASSRPARPRGMRMEMKAERVPRNARDMQIAWQAAEAGLVAAEFDITGRSANSTSNRSAVFKHNEVDLAKFIDNCGSADQSIGLC